MTSSSIPRWAATGWLSLILLAAFMGDVAWQDSYGTLHKNTTQLGKSERGHYVLVLGLIVSVKPSRTLRIRKASVAPPFWLVSWNWN